LLCCRAVGGLLAQPLLALALLAFDRLRLCLPCAPNSRPNLDTPTRPTRHHPARYGNTTLVHFEDLTYENASKVLNMYRTDLPCFNDDIQGMAAAVLAGGWAGGGDGATAPGDG
jgi:hypothetical protein